MVSTFIQSVSFLVNNVSSWMHEIFTKTDGIMIYLGAIAVFGSVRLLLRPFFGRRLANSGSDYAAPSDRKR